MSFRFRALLLLASAALVISPLFAAKLDGSAPGLIVHEWGTFTSVAGPNGEALDWLPLSGPSDLPCFVNHFQNFAPKGLLRGTVRMETPVVYFYNESPLEVAAKVEFPHGLITEWYPRATQVGPQAQISNDSLYNKRTKGSVEWASLMVAPRTSGREDLPVEKASSHYYAARDTGAATVHVSGTPEQQERFLFYRGVASFQPPLSVRLTGDEILLRVPLNQEIGSAILFENRDGKIGYSVHDRLSSDVPVTRPVLGADAGALRRDLEQILVRNGLFADEAHAMVETWRDSWFEEGARVFYIFPQPLLDSILPLSISPKPAKTARVFVGRIEVITPEMEQAVLNATLHNDEAGLKKSGRFLEAVLQRLVINHRATEADLNSAYQVMWSGSIVLPSAGCTTAQ